MDVLHPLLIVAGLALLLGAAGRRLHWRLRQLSASAWRIPRPAITWAAVGIGVALLLLGLSDTVLAIALR